MPGGNKAVARTVGVIVLLLLAVVALRGYLPGAEPAPDSAEPAPGGPSGFYAIVAMLAVSIFIIAAAILAQERRRAVPSPGELLRRRRGAGIKVPWRLLAILAAILIGWLLVMLLLMRWRSGMLLDEVPFTDPESGVALEGDEAEAPPPTPTDDGGVFGALVAAAVTLFVMSAAATWIGRRRAGAAMPPTAWAEAPAGTPSAEPDLARAAELGLVEIGDLSRDPREAIIACYAAMERELEKSPGTTPQDSDTPSEVLARAVERRALDADSAAELVDLFQEARFSPHVMNEGHRAGAVRALRLVQRDLQGAS